MAAGWAHRTCVGACDLWMCGDLTGRSSVGIDTCRPRWWLEDDCVFIVWRCFLILNCWNLCVHYFILIHNYSFTLNTTVFWDIVLLSLQLSHQWLIYALHKFINNISNVCWCCRCNKSSFDWSIFEQVWNSFTSSPRQQVLMNKKLLCPQSHTHRLARPVPSLSTRGRTTNSN